MKQKTYNKGIINEKSGNKRSGKSTRKIRKKELEINKGE
jgi:hypothetical protein